MSHIRTFCEESGWPSGNANFPRPILTEKAFPENEFLILPAISHEREYQIKGVYERRLGKRSMFEIGVPIENDGVGDVDIAFKHRGARERVSASYRSGCETGSCRTTRRCLSRSSPPARCSATGICKAQFKVELPVDRAKADRAVVYNAYLGRDTSAAPTTWTIGVELNGENHELDLTPQIRKGLNGHWSARRIGRRDAATQRT